MNDKSFYSIDRLVEFGLGMSIAQQMAKSMNETMNSMQIPSEQRMKNATPPPVFFYLAIDGKPAGPFSDVDVATLVANKTLTKDTLTWKPGMPTWKKACDVPEILRLVALAPPPIPTGDEA